MFYSDIILAKKGPLANIWLAAHLSSKLSKAQIFDTNIEGSVQSITQPAFPLALRVSGHLLLGVVRIYSRQVKYLFADCNYARSSLSKEYNNPNVDLPADGAGSSSSINLAGGFGNVEEYGDDDLLFVAPNVRRWANLAVYQRVDGGNDDDDDDDHEEDGIDMARSQHHSNMMQGHEPEAFTSFGTTGFGGTSGFGGGQGQSGFESEEEEDVEVGRARAEESRQSLGFDTSPVPAGDTSGVFADADGGGSRAGAGGLAPVDDSFNLGGDDGRPNPFADDSFYDAPEREEEEELRGGDGSREEEGDGAAAAAWDARRGEAATPPKPTRVKRRRVKVKYDDATTLPRKALRLPEQRQSQKQEAHRLQDRQLQVWRPFTERHPSAGAPGSLTGAARLDAVFFLPASGLAAPAALRMFQASLAGALRLGPAAAGPAKRGRESITGGDAAGDDEVEVARRRSEGEGGRADDSSMAWAAGPEGDREDEPFFDHSDVSMGRYGDDRAPLLDGDMSMGAQAAQSERPRNAALEDALRRHQMGAGGAAAADGDAAGGESSEASQHDGGEDSGHPAAEEVLHPRTLVMMREINRELGVDASSSGGSSSSSSSAAAAKRAAPKASLRFGDMISGFSKAPAAAAFFEVLALKTRGFIDVAQSVSFSDISITATGEFVDPAA